MTARYSSTTTVQRHQFACLKWTQESYGCECSAARRPAILARPATKLLMRLIQTLFVSTTLMTCSSPARYLSLWQNTIAASWQASLCKASAPTGTGIIGVFLLLFGNHLHTISEQR